MPYGFVAAAAVVGAYGSYRASKISAEASNRAADIQQSAAEKSLAFQKEVYGNIKPYLMQSLSGYQDLLQHPESVKQTPGYLFRLNEGLKSIGIPEGGRNLSGAQIKGALQYSQNYATSEYTNALARIAGLGQVAQGAYNVGSQYATAAGNTLMQGAQAQATGITNAANARAAGVLGMSSAVSQGLTNYGYGKLFQQQPSSYYGAGYSGYGGQQVPGNAYAPAYGGGA